ncbi:cadmium ion transporter [Exidia glandulosa HHB12029]|uniref:Cadmium ion transporter n=1 Tax=Exidia glandulosa HHB12029 TaxID=1314781 RepID=A0A165NR25_EXIGL|nr:cadmium ion transporter [Exidia glandulosa HHB12029]
MGLWQKLYHPPPKPPGFAEGKILPEPTASVFKRVSLGWITPLLFVGFSRPLQKNDLWELDETRRVTHIADTVFASYESRKPAGYTSTPSDTASSPSPNTSSPPPNTTTKSKKPLTPEETLAKSNESALLSALHSYFFRQFWFAGFLKVLADALTVTSPLVTNALLKFLAEAYAHAKAPEVFPDAPKVGRGFGLAVGLAGMQLVAAVCENHFQQRIMGTGMLVRSAVSAMIFRKSLRLSGKARITHSKGHITTMMSEDAPRFESAVYTLHQIWIAPIQLIVGIALLINTLKVSALVGLAVVVVSFPLQGFLLVIMFKTLRMNIATVDERVKILQEVLVGIRSVKMYAWEAYFSGLITKLRERELKLFKRFSLILSLLIAVTYLTPIGSSTLSFITYSLLKHSLDPATIFSALQLFGIIRMPLLMLPIATSSATQALLALNRVAKYLAAEEAPPPFEVTHDAGEGVVLDGAGFSWEKEEKVETPAAPSDAKEKKKAEKETKTEKKRAKAKDKAGLPPLEKDGSAGQDDGTVDLEKGPADPDQDEKQAAQTEDKDKEPFKLVDINMHVPRGALVALVGRVGSGKSSVLQALAGEMRQTGGEVTLGGSLAYVSQSPWIVNATLRENIIFGEPVDESRYQMVIRACQLQADLEMLQYGDQTEIGEKGINLSGGQKARVCLARAAYARSDIVLLDDPLSAVDAHVGRALVSECLLARDGPMAGRTKLLATHALHVLPHVDAIYVFEAGHVAEQGTYDELIARGGAFAKLVEEFGTTQGEDVKEKTKVAKTDEKTDVAAGESEALMQEEDRVVGQVQWRTYTRYFQAAGGVAWMPWLLFCLIMDQASQVGSNLFLGWWTGREIRGFGDGQYIAVYASLGAAQGLFALVTSFSFALAAIAASRALFGAALERVLRSPVSFFDTTPMGRIVSRLTKDVNTLDQGLAFIFYTLFTSSFGVFGTMGLVFYNFPYLGILFVPLGILYTFFFLFYRRNSVEVKRLDSILRSTLYSSYIEALSGIATIHATRQEGRFMTRTEDAIDQQNRAAYMTISIARWLNLRLNVFSSSLILGIGLFAVGERENVNPANVGVVLTYSLTVMGTLAELVSQFATMEQNLNAVERMIAFSELPKEGDAGGKEQPPAQWPSRGEIKFKNVVMAYREGLPDVLRDVSFELSAGEKVGVVGRTGAGKTSLVQVLLRMFEVKSGSIEVDSVDIRKLDLESFRSRLAVIPQDSLFLGTLRDTIDPLKLRTDAELLGILQKAHLLPSAGKSDPTAEAKFTLDASMGHEGVSLSAGEKQQLALCRVLVKQSKIIILDEATSSVDVETDSKLQQTIRTELADSTLLCIAHRLNTIVAYDRVLVMDQGHAAELDTPLALFDNEKSIFRSLCDQASLTRDDIVRMRKDAAVQSSGPPSQTTTILSSS